MTVFQLTKGYKFTLFGETKERVVAGFCGKDNTKVFDTMIEATRETKENNIFVVDTEDNVHDIEDINV